jgi:iron complex outermembrane receptor protein
MGLHGTYSFSTKIKKCGCNGCPTFREFITEKYGEGSEQALPLGMKTRIGKVKFGTAFSTDQNINVSGAIAQMPFRASFLIRTKMEFKNFKFTTSDRSLILNPKFIDKRLDVQLNVKRMYNKNRFANQGAIGMATQFDPTQPIYMTGSDYGNGYFMYLKSDGTPIDIALTNPVAMLNEREDESTVYRSIGNAQFDYKFNFLPGLRANLNMGYDVSNSDGDVIIKDNSPMTWTSGNFKKGFGENTHYTQYKEKYAS